MSTRKVEIKYNCDEDCKMSGCPTHTLKGTLQDTSDIVIIEDEKGDVVYSGDINKTNTLIDMFAQLDYEESIYFPRIKTI